ncbi:DUF6274 family protein [Streptomyces sp. 796.1]|uniref:DUF6274 family protein n=1 Tax=Streptomyces sp. 796.1 TaxID=3163029 RepID=UPI0039C96706
MATSTRHETRALLRAHLSAAIGYRHLTRHCPVCHRLLRLALEQPGPSVAPAASTPAGRTRPPEPGTGPTRTPTGPAADTTRDESPAGQ